MDAYPEPTEDEIMDALMDYRADDYYDVQQTLYFDWITSKSNMPRAC